MEIGQRVAVLSGDLEAFLGYGTYQGDVTTYGIITTQGDILTLPDAEKYPELLEGLQVSVIENNPKFILDNGDTVYGCQVFYKAVDVPQEVGIAIPDNT